MFYIKTFFQETPFNSNFLYKNYFDRNFSVLLNINSIGRFFSFDGTVWFCFGKFHRIFVEVIWFIFCASQLLFYLFHIKAIFIPREKFSIWCCVQFPVESTLCISLSEPFGREEISGEFSDLSSSTLLNPITLISNFFGA